MSNSMMNVGEKRANGKRLAQARASKSRMKGKGGPENSSCTYKGVRQRRWGRWVAEISDPSGGPRLWLGTFNTSREAAMAYDAAALRLYGAEARLNLPELAASTSLPQSGSIPVRQQEIIAVERETSVGVSTEPVMCANNFDPSYKKTEEINDYGFPEDLKTNFLEFGDPSIWEEAGVTMDLQEIENLGKFGDFEDEKIWDAVEYPWGY